MAGTTTTIDPWARGPYELLRHANGHLEDGGDTDRRIALIGFDNAIEVCIDVFIRLHPRLRGGLAIPREEVEQASRNYHTKIEFLDRYIETHQLPIDISTEAIVWYHSLRNELYHSGNGMVPEKHVIEGAREAAISVFKALFKTDVAPLLGTKTPKPGDKTPRIPFTHQNDEMEFLRIFIEFERALQNAVPEQIRDSGRARSPMQMWRAYQQTARSSGDVNGLVEHAIQVRNQIVHGQETRLGEDDLIALSVRLMDLTDSIKAANKKPKSTSLS